VETMSPRDANARACAGSMLARRAAAALAAFLSIAPLPGLAAGDPVHGEQVYKICRACHSLDKNGAGPKHQGVFGRAAGAVPDYCYSPALQKSGLVWDEQTLDKWLADPQKLVPGTKMFFALDNAKDRADVIEYLKEKSGSTVTP
jgi:cytochrome c